MSTRSSPIRFSAPTPATWSARIHHADGEGAEAAAALRGRPRRLCQAEDRPPPRRSSSRTSSRTIPRKRLAWKPWCAGPRPTTSTAASLYLGVLLYEDGKFADAQTRFAAFVQATPTRRWRPRRNLRIGFCHVQLKQFAEAIKTLQPLADKEPQLADQGCCGSPRRRPAPPTPPNRRRNTRTP